MREGRGLKQGSSRQNSKFSNNRWAHLHILESGPQNPQIPEQIDSMKTLSRISIEFELEFITRGRISGHCLQWNFEMKWVLGVNNAFEEVRASISVLFAAECT